MEVKEAESARAQRKTSAVCAVERPSTPSDDPGFCQHPRVRRGRSPRDARFRPGTFRTPEDSEPWREGGAPWRSKTAKSARAQRELPAICAMESPLTPLDDPEGAGIVAVREREAVVVGVFEGHLVLFQVRGRSDRIGVFIRAPRRSDETG